MNFKSILSYLGTILEILGILILIPIFIAWIYEENIYLNFLVPATISFILGSFLDRYFKKDELTLGSAVVLSALSFILISLIGSIPYLSYLPPLDAVFESVSGFTTTGLTVVVPEDLPNSLLFWRSFTQWIGGIGILIIFLLLISSPGISSYYLYQAQTSGQKIEASVSHTVKKMFKIYSIYTVVGIILLTIAGMPFFDAILHSFTSISTGGFSPKSESIGFYNNPSIEIIIILLMVLGSTSFFVHDKLFKLKFKQYVENMETRIFWIIILFFSVLVSFSFLTLNDPVRNGIFQTFSALTTTGYTTLSSNIPNVSKSLLIILMIIGGYAGSTAGGIKLVRFGVLGKSIAWISRKISLPPTVITPFKFGKKLMKDADVTIISIFICIYILILSISSVFISFLGYPPLDSFFEVASAEGTVGLSVIDLKPMHWSGKIVLIINMLFGRLEILPFLTLFYSIYRAVYNKFFMS